jgi:N-acyl-D-amino-acid deacylase
MTITATRRGFTAGLAALAVSPAIAEARKSGRYDTIVRGGTVFDGLGGEGREADVGIIAGKIATIGNLSAARGALELDAKGQAVAPGFINMLSWATESLIEDGRSQSDIRQGVTLEVMGEGWSMGPLTAEMKARERREQGDIKFDIGWTTLGQYLNFLEAKGGILQRRLLRGCDDAADARGWL